MTTKQTVMRFRIEASLKQALMVSAEKQDLTASQLVRRLIRDYLKSKEQGNLAL